MRVSVNLTVLSLSMFCIIIPAADLVGQQNVDHLLSYQGHLTDAVGDPVPDATYSIVFSIYDDSTAGSLLWTENHPAVATEGGLFNVYLGSNVPLPVDSLTKGDPYNPVTLFLQVQVGGDPPITPRTRLGGTLYSAVSQRINGDVETAPGMQIMTEPGGTDTTIIFDATTGTGIWRDYLNNRQATVQGSSIGITEIGARQAAIAIKSSSDEPRLTITSSSAVETAELTVTGALFSSPGLTAELTLNPKSQLKLGSDTDSATYSQDKAEMTDADGNKLELTPTGASVTEGAPGGFSSSWSPTGSSFYNESTGDSLIVNLDVPLMGLGLYGSNGRFEATPIYFKASDFSDGTFEYRLEWNTNGKCLNVGRYGSTSDASMSMNPSLVDFIHSDASSTDTVVSFGSDSTSGGWFRVRDRGTGSSWSEWSAPRFMMHSSSGDSLMLQPFVSGWYGTDNKAEITPSSIELSSTVDNSNAIVTNDSFKIEYNNGIDSNSVMAKVTAFYPTFGVRNGTLEVEISGYNLQMVDRNPVTEEELPIISLDLVSTNPIFALRKHGTDPTDAPAFTYSYDDLNRLVGTHRAYSDEPGDSTVTSATGVQIYDGDMVYTYNNGGLEFYDGALGMQTLVANGAGDVTAVGSMTATNFFGNGYGLTDLSADNISSGTLAPAYGGLGSDLSGATTGSMLLLSPLSTWASLPPGSEGQVLQITGGMPAWKTLSLSDRRLKKNISTIRDALDNVLLLRGVSYEWDKDKPAAAHFPEGKQIGLVAQEVEQVFPELVTTAGEENYRAVDYDRLTAVLIEAIKELKAENDELRKRLESLEHKTGM